MKGILFAALAAIAALVGGTFYVVFSQASVSYHAAVDHCHDAGGAWLPNGARSYSGSCLRAPQIGTRSPDPMPRPAPGP